LGCIARWFAAVAVALSIIAQPSAAAAGELNIAPADTRLPIEITADRADHWTEGTKDDSRDVWLLKGNCKVRQGPSTVQGDEAVVWVERVGDFGNPTYKVVAYMDSPHFFGRLYSIHAPSTKFDESTDSEPDAKPAVYQKALERIRSPGGIMRTQFTEFQTEQVPPPQFAAPVVGSRRVQVLPRSGLDFDARSLQNPAKPGELVHIATGGVQIRIDGLGRTVANVRIGETLDISADRVDASGAIPRRRHHLSRRRPHHLCPGDVLQRPRAHRHDSECRGDYAC
jgi:hypothetical protein